MKRLWIIPVFFLAIAKVAFAEGNAPAELCHTLLADLTGEVHNKLSVGLKQELAKRDDLNQTLTIVFDIEPPTPEEVEAAEKEKPTSESTAGVPWPFANARERALRKRIEKFLVATTRFAPQGVSYVGPLWAPEWPLASVAMEVPRSLIPTLLAHPLVLHVWAGDPLIELGDPAPGTPEHFRKAQILFYREWLEKHAWHSYSYSANKEFIVYVRTPEDARVFPKTYGGYPVTIKVLDPKNQVAKLRPVFEASINPEKTQTVSDLENFFFRAWNGVSGKIQIRAHFSNGKKALRKGSGKNLVKWLSAHQKSLKRIEILQAPRQ